jgi:hypothetical protein
MILSRQAEVLQNHDNAKVANRGQGEAQDSKSSYKRLKHGSGQAYRRSGTSAAVMA